jgi:hypothetical protein
MELFKCKGCLIKQVKAQESIVCQAGDCLYVQNMFYLLSVFHGCKLGNQQYPKL